MILALIYNRFHVVSSCYIFETARSMRGDAAAFSKSPRH
jgi:hypothetical protein